MRGSTSESELYYVPEGAQRMFLSSTPWARCHGVISATHGPNHSPMPETQTASCPHIQLCHETCWDNFLKVWGRNSGVATEGKTRP